jgi:hypothetical protein
MTADFNKATVYFSGLATPPLAATA